MTYKDPRMVERRWAGLIAVVLYDQASVVKHVVSSCVAGHAPLRHSVQADDRTAGPLAAIGAPASIAEPRRRVALQSPGSVTRWLTCS
jgi:hypothetical protein